MRIVYFLPDVDAGVSRIVKTLLRYRPLNNALTYVVVLFRGEEPNTNIVGDDFNADEILRFSYKSGENAWSVFKRASRILLSDKDIIVGNDGFEVRMVAALKLKNPVIYIMHGDFSYYYSIAKLYHPLIDCFITYSNKIEQQLKNILPVTSGNKVYKVYYPSASLENKSNPDVTDRKRMFTILFAGLLIERKGADLLYDIYNDLHAKGMRDFDFEIIGTGELLDLVTKQFSNCRNVTIAGWQTNEYVIKKMSLADVFLFPSTLEGLPNVLVEALSAGAVPVASNLESGVADIIENGVNGILVEAGNVNDFAGAILKLYREPGLLRSMKSNAALHLKKFEPYKQSACYQQLIVATAEGDHTVGRFYPRYKKGRVLDHPWLPNKLVVFLRRHIKNPKL